jgi:hypothetical protein
MLYVGVKKGSFDDSYITSSKFFNSEYDKRPEDFSRKVLANCTWEEALNLEERILSSLNAAVSEQFYNKSNGCSSFVCNGHSDETRAKMSKTWKNKGAFNCDSSKAQLAWTGSKHTEETKQKMSKSKDKYRKVYSDRMKKNNPMKNPETIAKMLETRRKNKELRNGTTN